MTTRKVDKLCKHGETETVVVKHRSVKVDKCLVPYIKALNTNGIETCISCCGHGEIEGSIMTMVDGEYRLVVLYPAEKGTPKLFSEKYRVFHEKFENEKTGQGGN